MKGEANSIEYEIQLTPLALEMLAEVKDRREQEKLRDRIDKLKIEPEKQGKALVDNLSGFRSIRAVDSAIALFTKSSKSELWLLL
ncbi:MAG: hypothetical protein ABI180_00590 [Microcoleus sp.]|jgi:mRNA interferase RelE/StbE